MNFKSVNLPKEFYISDYNQFEVGMPIWKVGFGGSARLEEPYLMGSFLKARDNVITYALEDGFVSNMSGTDRNVGMVNGYNNWFICGSEEQAIVATAYLNRVWEVDPHFEYYMIKKQKEADRLDELMFDPDGYDEYHYDDAYEESEA